VSQEPEAAGRGRQAVVDFAGEVVASASRMGMELAAGVSGGADAPGELPRLASESRLALERRRIGGGESVVVYSESGTGQAAAGPALADSEQDLRRALALGDAARARDVVRAVLARLQASASQPALSEVLVQLYGLVTRYSVEPVPLTGGKPLLQTLAGIRTVSSADLFLSRLVTAVCGQRREIEHDAESRHHRRIMEYVERNYGNPAVSMDSLASALRLSPSYVYRILRDREKRSFVELLTERRIERARALLLRNLKVQEVAGRVGFSSAKYFIRVFKQQTGYTPNRYRKAV
jgi:two-component system response regulator YesN